MFSNSLLLILGTLLGIGFNNKFVYGYSGEEVCNYIENNLECNSDPCDCKDTDFDANCNICDNNNGINNGCTQCSNGYFHYETELLDYQCAQCSLIDNCLHCTADTGCQQCDNSCTIYETTCGIFTCDCNGGSNPNPIPSPTSSPTEVDLNSKIEGLRGAFDSFWISRDTSILNEMKTYYDTSINELICWGGFECSTVDDFFNNFAGLCDGGTISEFSDIVFQDLRVIYSFYRACLNYNNNFGLFWLNGVGITKYNTNGEIIDMTVNWRSIDNVEPILQQYKNSVNP